MSDILPPLRTIDSLFQFATTIGQFPTDYAQGESFSIPFSNSDNHFDITFAQDGDSIQAVTHFLKGVSRQYSTKLFNCLMTILMEHNDNPAQAVRFAYSREDDLVNLRGQFKLVYDNDLIANKNNYTWLFTQMTFPLLLENYNGILKEVLERCRDDQVPPSSEPQPPS